MEEYLNSRDFGVADGLVPLNENKKINSQYLPAYTEANIFANDSIADLSARQTWSSEQTYNYTQYGLELKDTIAGVATGFKSPRGLFNQLFIDDIVFVRKNTETNADIKDEIGFYIWTGVESDNSTLIGYKKSAAITKDGGLILKSSTSGSSKFFKITVSDSGTISTVEA